MGALAPIVPLGGWTGSGDRCRCRHTCDGALKGHLETCRAPTFENDEPRPECRDGQACWNNTLFLFDDPTYFDKIPFARSFSRRGALFRPMQNTHFFFTTITLPYFYRPPNIPISTNDYPFDFSKSQLWLLLPFDNVTVVGGLTPDVTGVSVSLRRFRGRIVLGGRTW